MLLTIKTPYTCMEFQVTSMQARQLIDEAYQMAVSTLNEEDSNNPLFCPPFDLPDVSEFDEAPDNSEFVIGPAASEEGIEAATKSDEDTKTAPVFYKGMLLIRCPKCGNTWGACYHEAIKQYHCKCGNAIPLKDLKKVFLKCTCGRAYKYMTNIEEEQFSFPCYGCKKEIQLFRGKDAYYTAGRDDTAE